MRTNGTIGIVVSTMVALAAQGCAAAPLDEEQAQSEGAPLTKTTGEDTIIASLRTRADTTVSFMSGADDELGVSIVGTIGRTDPELESASRDAGDDAVALFERLAGKTAPVALKQAADRAARAASFAGASDEGESEIASPTGTLVAPGNPAASGGFCSITNSAPGSSGAFTYCWPNQYSTPWVKKKVDHMACRFDVVQGPTRVRYRYKTASGWHTPADFVLSSGQYMQRNGYYRHAKRWRECKTVENAFNRQHHFRVVGHEQLSGLPFSPDPFVVFP